MNKNKLLYYLMGIAIAMGGILTECSKKDDPMPMSNNSATSGTTGTNTTGSTTSESSGSTTSATTSGSTNSSPPGILTREGITTNK